MRDQDVGIDSVIPLPQVFVSLRLAGVMTVFSRSQSPLWERNPTSQPFGDGTQTGVWAPGMVTCEVCQTWEVSLGA